MWSLGWEYCCRHSIHNKHYTINTCFPHWAKGCLPWTSAKHPGSVDCECLQWNLVSRTPLGWLDLSWRKQKCHNTGYCHLWSHLVLGCKKNRTCSVNKRLSGHKMKKYSKLVTLRTRSAEGGSRRKTVPSCPCLSSVTTHCVTLVTEWYYVVLFRRLPYWVNSLFKPCPWNTL